MSHELVKDLVGLRVVAVTEEHEDLVIDFDNGGLLRVDLQHVSSPPGERRNLMAGRIVTSAVREPDFLRITMDGDIQLAIDLRAETYHSPEAMSIRLPGHKRIIE